MVEKTNKLSKEKDLLEKIKEIKQTKLRNKASLLKKTNLDNKILFQFSNQEDIEEVKDSETENEFNYNFFYDQKLVDEKLNIEDYTCIICLNLLLKPVTTDCKHNFCYKCFEIFSEKNAIENLKCPLCREVIKYNKSKIEPNVKLNTFLDELLKKKFEKEYSIRLKTLESISNNYIKVRFTYGNTYYFVENVAPLKSDPSLKCCYGYTLFFKAVSVSEGMFKKNVTNFRTSDFVKSVKYTLHSTYKNPEKIVTTEPFNLMMRAWGWFDVPIKIKLNKGFVTEDGLNEIELNHTLIFEEGGEKKEIVIKLFNNK